MWFISISLNGLLWPDGSALDPACRMKGIYLFPEQSQDLAICAYEYNPPYSVIIIDYDRHIALVAISESQPEEKMLGIALVILGRTLKEAEFSGVVSDLCQGEGIGAALLQGCLGISREREIQKVTGTVLAENTQMLALGRKLGFKMKKEPSVPEYELSIDLEQN